MPYQWNAETHQYVLLPPPRPPPSAKADSHLHQQVNAGAQRGKELFNALVPVRAWVKDKQLRSWMTGLLVVLVAVPAIGASIASLETRAWVLAGFFAVAWLLLLFIIIRPHITVGPLVVVVILGLIIETPLAIALETMSGGHVNNIFASVFEVGIPEELTKMVPVLVVAAVVLFFKPKTGWLALSPRDFLFLGAVSGAVFGASEAVHYAVQIGTAGVGTVTGTTVEQVLLSFGTWRFLTDPISHACWAGIAGYFIGLAIQEYRRGMTKPAAIALGCTGLAIASVLHGFNDWVASPPGFFFVLVNVLSVLVFLGYARVGTSSTEGGG